MKLKINYKTKNERRASMWRLKQHSTKEMKKKKKNHESKMIGKRKLENSLREMKMRI